MHSIDSQHNQSNTVQCQRRKTESHINSFPNYTADITDDDGTTFKIHFVALFSEKKDAVPITFLHGWPGSFLEFLPILSLLKSKYSAADLPYHVIVPSLQGYGYSADSIPKNKNWTKHDSARIINKLMVGLGFGDGYAAQGGDIGSYLTRILAAKYKECKAAHCKSGLLPCIQCINHEPNLIRLFDQ
jgi:microsomal epoxide hydrolase